MMLQDEQYQDLVRQAQLAEDDVRRQLVDKLVLQFTTAAHQWALLILDDEEKASDALQEAWLNAFLHLDQLRESAAFPAWFRQLVLSSCYRAIRSESNVLPLEEQLTQEPVAPTDVVDEVERKERSDHIRGAVLALPEHERIVTELYYFADYPQQEIAEVLSVPLTTVKKRLQYAREHLRGLIQPEIVSQLSAFNGGCAASAFQNPLFIGAEWENVRFPEPLAVSADVGIY